MQLSNLRTRKQILEECPALSPGGLDWMVFNRTTNGLQKAGAVYKIQGKLYFDLPKFTKALELMGRESA